MASTDYKGSYKKMFPGTLSSNSLLTVYILHLLSGTTRMYGKEIADTIADRLEGTWIPSHGLIYPMLRKMEKQGLVSGYWEDSTSKRTRRFYELTELGRGTLDVEANKIRPAFDQSVQMLDIMMDELYTEESATT